MYHWWARSPFFLQLWKLSSQKCLSFSSNANGKLHLEPDWNSLDNCETLNMIGMQHDSSSLCSSAPPTLRHTLTSVKTITWKMEYWNKVYYHGSFYLFDPHPTLLYLLPISFCAISDTQCYSPLHLLIPSHHLPSQPVLPFPINRPFPPTFAIWRKRKIKVLGRVFYVLSLPLKTAFGTIGNCRLSLH